ncbi:hypothetical protein RHD99_05570 [Buttiauxella selenatireducens]|uniref:Phage tail protein C-terminal domain-containing protein n=1 Tax=Buttiauxella selenatireducens TaxID=3073902 RepID=A0ABY9SEQ5_9ENTR|nr:hypothetical protein [Buttiauxella sp. R73]WMY75428.1 hypothetical protein RHD99_05570 [Buttiauxella sp. R73]
MVLRKDSIKPALPVTAGGTGADTVSGAQSALGLVPQTGPTDITSGRILKVGAFGLGTQTLQQQALSSSLPGGTFLTKALLGGIDNNASILVVPFNADTQYQIIFPTIVGAKPRIHLRLQSVDPQYNGQLSQVYTDANTTKAADGTLKAASPVIKVFHDGRSESNDESEGVTVVRKGIGEYLIQGCIGLNADAAWGGINGGFDVPQDRNRQPLIWLDFEVNPDGSVLVKTYHRTHPAAPAFARNQVDGVADGDPIDIPADQFISVRVEMPEDSIYNQKIMATKKAMEDAERAAAEKAHEESTSA